MKCKRKQEKRKLLHYVNREKSRNPNDWQKAKKNHKIINDKIHDKYNYEKKNKYKRQEKLRKI